MRRQQRPSLKRFARIHFWVMFFSFTAYLAFGFVLGPEFFKQDILKRIAALADDVITVTATVLGPPARPVVTATDSCVSGAPRIALHWAADAATDTWDIARDGTTLTTGLSQSQYADTSVIANTAYSYVVTAFGPMSPGSAISVPVSVTTPACSSALPSPTVTIQTIGNASVATDRSDASSFQTRPRITGTTNIANALIGIAVTNPSIQAQFTANAAGYFSWIPPVGLDTGSHTLSVTVTDPNDAMRTATDGFVFRTKDDDQGTGTGNDGSDNHAESAGLQTGQATLPVSQPDFSVRVNSGAQLVFQGDALEITLSIDKPFPAGTVFHGFILDASGKEVYDLGALTAAPAGTHFDGLQKPDAPQGNALSDAADTVAQASGRMILRTMKRIPLSLDPGTYRVRVDALYEGHIISREVALTIKAWPLIQFGSGNEITYPQVTSLIGTIFLVLLSLFILFLLLFVREYWLYLHHLRFVDERSLRRLGLISPKRKGVAR